MRPWVPSWLRSSHSGCSCTTLDTMYLCDSHLPWPSSTPKGSHQSCTRIPCLWKSSVIFLIESPGKVSADRKSTRLNSSHQIISYAVFCLKKKKKKSQHDAHYYQVLTIT